MGAPKNKEEWKKINDKYYVSSFGNVKSVDSHILTKAGRRFYKGRILKFGQRKDGYVVVNITGHRQRKNHRVHQLVAQFFLENPFNLKCINHKNGIKNDNRVENLEWCSYSENLRHSYRIGLSKPVRNFEGRNGFAKKVIDSVSGKIYDSVTQLCRLESLNYSATNAMLNGQNVNKTRFHYV